MSEPLSAADLDSILGELAAEGISAVSPVDVPPEPATAEIQPYVFGQDAARPTEKLNGLQRIGEKLQRALKPVIEPLARTRVQVTAQPIETLAYEQWTEQLPFFTSLSLYRLRPLKGGMLVQVDPGFIAELVESFYGGVPGAPRRARSGDFTQSEELLLKRLLDGVVGSINEHWRELAPVEMALAARETNCAHMPFVRPDEAVVVQRFAVAVGAGTSTIAVLYPLGMIRPIEARIATKVHDDEANTNDAWRQKMGAALAQVRLPVRSVLARPEISVAGLLALKVGDVIPITLAPRTPLLAGQRRIADGVIGEQEGRAALRIDSVGTI